MTKNTCMNKKSKALILLSIVLTIVILFEITYSWIARNWSPSITQNDITISSTGALLIGIGDDKLFNTVSLNDITGIDTFTFKQVSSADGVNFSSVDFIPALKDEPPVYTFDDPSDRYINVDFYLKLQKPNDQELMKKKYVFLHPDTKIEDCEEGTNVSKAIRMALTIDSINNNEPFIMGKTDDGYDTIQSTTWAARNDAKGKNLYTNFPSDKTLSVLSNTQQRVYSLKYFNGGRRIYDNDNNPENDYDFTVDPDRMIFTLAPGEIRKVNLKIWLEGGDENCVDAIAGKSFSMVLKFDSKEVKDG